MGLPYTWNAKGVLEDLNFGKTKSEIARERGVGRQVLGAWISRHIKKQDLYLYKNKKIQMPYTWDAEGVIDELNAGISKSEIARRRNITRQNLGSWVSYNFDKSGKWTWIEGKNPFKPYE